MGGSPCAALLYPGLGNILSLTQVLQTKVSRSNWDDNFGDPLFIEMISLIPNEPVHASSEANVNVL